jgi:GNAT superfamily N-acetyltransferase
VDVDLSLVQRLESTSATASLDLIAGIKSLDRSTAAEGREFHAGALVAMGSGRYVNRAIGVTIGELSANDLDEIEQFFGERHLPSMMELSSWAPASTLKELAQRNYVPMWFRSVFALTPTLTFATARAGLRIERVEDADENRWLDVFARGFEAEQGEVRVANDEIGRAGRIAPNAHTFLAFIDDDVVGCGSVQFVDGVAWLGGAATVPEFRQRGVQAALVSHRLDLATAAGCELAAVSALSDGPSARNIVRLGFQHIHTQVVAQQQR